MTSTLESLLSPAVDLQPALTAYRAVLREAAQAHRPPDDFKFADRLASPARRLGLSAVAIRQDAEQFVKMHRLEGRFSTAALEEAQRELERVRKPDILYSTSGETALTMGYCDELYHISTRDKRLEALRIERKQATDDAELAEIREKVAAVEEEAARLARRTRLAEDRLIVLLAARDRIGAARQRSRRLFPATEDS